MLCGILPCFAMQPDPIEPPRITDAFKQYHGDLENDDLIRSITYWVAKGVDVNFTDAFSQTLLYLAILSNKPGLVWFLIKHQADVEMKNQYGATPLSLASSKGNIRIIKLLLEDGNANIESKGKAGQTPLIDAIQSHQLPAVELLLNHNANIEAKSHSGLTALDYAIYDDALKIATLLLQKGAKCDDIAMSILFNQAMEKGDQALIEELFKRGMSIETQNKKGITPIMQAISEKHLESIRVLLDHDARIEPAQAELIFDLALHNHHSGLIKSLQARGFKTDFNKYTPYGETPLTDSIINDDYDTIEFLIQQGADPSVKNKAGFNAFHYAQNNSKLLHILNQNVQGIKAIINAAAAEISQEALLTPTEIHYQKFHEVVDAYYDKSKRHKETKQPVLQDPIVKECIEKERVAYQQGNYVFYRAEPGKYRVYEFFLDELHQLLRPLIKTKKSFIFTRFFEQAPQQQTINEYLNTQPWSVYKPQNILLSANIPLFGNISHLSSCTWEYFAKNAEAQGGAEPSELFAHIFDAYGFNKNYIEPLLHLSKSLEDAASLQQIIIPQHIVDNVVTLSTSGYCIPWQNIVEESCWDPSAISTTPTLEPKLGRHTCISTIIDKYRQEQIDIDDALQVRILTNALYTLNPESGITFNLYTDLSKQKIIDLKNHVKMIADTVFGEWLARQIGSDNKPISIDSEEFRTLLTHYGKSDPARQKSFFDAFKAANAHKNPALEEEMHEETKEAAEVSVRDRAQAVTQQAARVAHEEIESGARLKRKQFTKKLHPLEPATIWQAYAKLQGLLNDETIIDSFIQDCARDEVHNAFIPEKTAAIARIATYNVHFWTDPFKKTNYEEIIKTIKTINADILLLQEVELFENKKIEEELRTMGYVYQPFMPMDQIGKNRFGNMILSKYPLMRPPFQHIYESSKDKEEKRNFINVIIQLPDTNTLSIYGTHLNVRDETGAIRLQEAAELMEFVKKDTTKNILLAGDWNAVRPKDYQYKVADTSVWKIHTTEFLQRAGKQKGLNKIPTEALQYIEKNGFKDCFTKAGINGPYYTVWTGTIVDFIFCCKSWNLPIDGCYIYFSAASDHLPVIMDVKIG